MDNFIFMMVAVATTSLLLLLTILIYFARHTPEGPKGSSIPQSSDEEVVIVFVDAPDPDNPAAVAAIAKFILPETKAKNPHLHVVLTGRPVNLGTKKATELHTLKQLVRQPEEVSVSNHSERVLEDAACRFENYLVNCNISRSTFTIYEGGVAPSAPLSDSFHEWDFLFDRRDLFTGDGEDAGEIVSHAEYKTLINQYNDLSQVERERQFLLLLRRFNLKPLSDLLDLLHQSHGEIIIFLGGPATALTQLFTGQGEDLRARVSSVFGMYGALEPGRGTLLANQFNVACDVEAACEFLIDNIFPSADKYMVTTETCKNTELVVSADDLSGRGVRDCFIDLQRLWEETHGGKPQPIFDVIPVMASLEKYRTCFKWTRQRAVLKEWKGKDEEEVIQVFSFIDSRESEVRNGQGSLYVSQREIISLNKEDLLNFLTETWS